MSNGTTTLPSIGAQLLEVDSRNTTGMFQTPRYNPGPTLGTAGGDVSWIERAGMNVGDAFGGLGGKLGEISDVGKMGMIGGLGNIAAGLIGSGRRKKEQRDAITEYDKMRKAYQNLDTSNIYAGVKNQYANLENTFEDVTINQKQAQFEAQQGAQQRANIMQGLQGAAGGSGIAGLAQAMANQAQQQTQQASASIGQQEATQQRLMAQQAGRIQMAERGGEAQAERLRLSGAESARGLEWQKTGTLLGMAQERKHAADEARAQATQNLTGGIGQVAGSMLTGGIL